MNNKEMIDQAITNLFEKDSLWNRLEDDISFQLECDGGELTEEEWAYAYKQMSQG